MNMSSSAPKMQPVPEASPFRYAEVQPTSGAGSAASAEQAAEERIRRSEAEAFERGRQSGEQQLRASYDAAIAGARNHVLQTINEFARERSSYYRRVEGEVVQLALAIARKILHREAQLDPQALAGIVRVTLEKLDAGTRIDLHVHPQEAADWRHYFACQMEGPPVPEVHEDPALPTGECRIVTSLGSTEIGIQSQLKEIETGLLDLLAERPDTNLPTSAPGASTTSSAGRETR